jgi:hypothetical protein
MNVGAEFVKGYPSKEYQRIEMVESVPFKYLLMQDKIEMSHSSNMQTSFAMFDLLFK